MQNTWLKFFTYLFVIVYKPQNFVFVFIRNPGTKVVCNIRGKVQLKIDIDSIFIVMPSINNIYHGEIGFLLCEVLTEKFHGHSLLLIEKLQYSYEF